MSAPHWLRVNHLEKSPRYLLFFDTETVPVSAERQNEWRLRLWAARLVRRRSYQPKRPREERFRGKTADELADLVDSLARSDTGLWLVAHNVGFDLAVTALPATLAHRGWRITESALTSDDPWCRMAKGTRRITIVDSWSWLPAPLAKIGEVVGTEKPPLPATDDPEADWWERCEADVEILTQAYLEVLDWWDRQKAGHWSVTGPATGWSSLRHMLWGHRILVVPDPDRRAFEAHAIYGGRRDVTRVGKLPPGLYVDIDLALAHLTAMAECRLPFRPVKPFEKVDVDNPLLDNPLVGIIAECLVSTTEPRYPLRTPRGIWHPVGRFWTVLAGPEINEARRRGDLRAIGRGWWYAMGHYHRPWALWIASLLDDRTEDVPDLVRLMAKHWSQCVAGKWAGHTSRIVRRRPTVLPGWHVERGILAETGTPVDFLTIAGEELTIARDEWSDDAFPAILAYIQSYTRVALNRLLDAFEPYWLVCNTDGLIVDALAFFEGQVGDLSNLASIDEVVNTIDDILHRRINPLIAPFTARIKQVSQHLTILSPQHVLLDAERKLAGIPPRAKAIGPYQYRFDTWPKLKVQLTRPSWRLYRQETRIVDLSRLPVPRWRGTDDVCRPIAVDTNGLPPWEQRVSVGQLTTNELHPIQHPALKETVWRAGTPPAIGVPVPIRRRK